MNKWYQIFHKNTGLSPYVWVVFCILPFYFIFRSSSPYEVVSGIIMIILFFVCYRLSFVSKGWLVYFWTSVQIVISIAMTLLFSYVYFSIFLAFFIGNIQNRAGFFTLYTIHIVSTFVTVNYGFATQNKLFFTQFPFILISLIVVILIPFNTFNRNRQGELEGQLEDANKRISELVKMEERQRIARDLHDTLGQKLSLIGLKSDLAGKLMVKNPAQAQVEMNDVRQTARMALKEVREMVTQMRGTRLEDEMFRIKQILKAAEIEFQLVGEPILENTDLLTENVLSMCLKEAVTNVVKHSGASTCSVTIESARTELVLKVADDGVGIAEQDRNYRGHGLQGMKERLEFVNGSLEIVSNHGATLIIRVPKVLKQT
ncbi:two-component system sensor histidine kinase DesK [Paenibacillus castaneae]|uniref:sensor histidine kinase n=1 Tax=Paenibacillus castaneae TaxID=474957 RepID=UPI000C9BD4F7|nr:sensor histidine kinase [Paenibacillus castaneae]NIK80419.1 two-component system sensor histidine kinase DesK [Paenibacillus castaneae]